MGSTQFILTLGALCGLVNGVVSTSTCESSSGGNGSKISITTFPFMVSVHGSSAGSHHCTGVIISPEWVVTTAYCLDKIAEKVRDKRSKRRLYVLAGASSIIHWGRYYQKRVIHSYSIHPQYKSGSVENDIGVVKVVGNFRPTEHVGFTSIPSFLAGESIQSCITVGWVGSENGEWRNTFLESYPVEIIDTLICLKYYQNVAVSLGQSLCSTWASRENLPCQSDIGAPLLCDFGDDHGHHDEYDSSVRNDSKSWILRRKNATKFDLVALSSLGYACGKQGAINYETNLIHYHEWVYETINGSSGHACDPSRGLVGVFIVFFICY